MERIVCRGTLCIVLGPKHPQKNMFFPGNYRISEGGGEEFGVFWMKRKGLMAHDQ